MTSRKHDANRIHGKPTRSAVQHGPALLLAGLALLARRAAQPGQRMAAADVHTHQRDRAQRGGGNQP